MMQFTPSPPFELGYSPTTRGEYAMQSSPPFAPIGDSPRQRTPGRAAHNMREEGESCRW